MKIKEWLQSLSFRTGVIVLLCCIPFYILSFAQMLLPISATAKGILWAVLFGLGKNEDWMVHMIGHSIGAWTHAPHGFCLASVSMAYYHRAMKPGLGNPAATPACSNSNLVSNTPLIILILPINANNSTFVKTDGKYNN